MHYTNTLEMLKEDHRKVAELFSQAEAAEGEAQRRKLFEQIKTELEAHAHLEETAFYPALKQRDELKDLVLEALEEHKQVKTLLREIENLVEGSEKFDAKLKVLKDNVEHHVEEEENEMFQKIRQVFQREELEQLGQELADARKEYAKTSKARTGSR
ncbi:MAG TPA: hemerythrin domain-containing protein [Blastocatellia bacterium]|nr:hemerythrin domain-containing protein [Blastocatellia bacterium]